MKKLILVLFMLVFSLSHAQEIKLLIEKAEKASSKNEAAEFYTQAGNKYFDRRDFNSAIEMYRTAMPLFDAGKSYELQKMAMLNAAESFEQINMRIKTLEFLELLLPVAVANQDTTTLLEVYPKMISLYENFGKAKEALSTYKTYQSFSDSLHAAQRVERQEQRQEDFEAKLAVIEAERDAALTKADDAESSKNTTKYLFYITALILGGLCIVLGSALFASFKNLNSKRKAFDQELEQMKVEVIKAKEEVQSSQLVREKLLGIVANDIKAPLEQLNAIYQNIQVNVTGNHVERIKLIRNQFDIAFANLFMILNNAYNWTLDQNLQIVSTPKRFDYGKLLEETIQQFIYAADAKGLKVKLSSEENLFVTADRNQLYTVLSNLISNAVKYSESKEILIQSNSEGGIVKTRITDHGIGIEPAKLRTLFKEEDVVSKPGTRNEKGTGLGLIIAKKLMDKNKGKIWAESEPGKGSTFSISLAKS